MHKNIEAAMEILTKEREGNYKHCYYQRAQKSAIL